MLDLIFSSWLKNLTKIEVLNQTDTELELRIFEEGHTFMNLLRKELFNDPSVSHAGYLIKHPLIKEVRFYVKVKGDISPIEALKKALKRLEEKIDEFETTFESISTET